MPFIHNRDTRVSIYDLIGHQIFSQAFGATTGIEQINLSEIVSGFYLLKVEVNGQTERSQRIIVVRP